MGHWGISLTFGLESSFLDLKMRTCMYCKALETVCVTEIALQFLRTASESYPSSMI